MMPRSESAEAELDVVVAGQIKEERESCGDELADHRSQGGASHLQPGQAEQAENQYGVQDDVDDRPDCLSEQGVHGASGGLKHPVKGDL
jgi:hypothetical protein